MKKSKLTPKELSARSKKAWVTRKANGTSNPTKTVKKAVSNRSEAAQRAWETRRANGTINGGRKSKKVVSSRSEAANRAWETRRANGTANWKNGIRQQSNNYISFEEASTLVRILNITTIDQWRAFAQAVNGEKKLPDTPAGFLGL